MQTSVTRRKPRTTHRPTHTLLPTLQIDYTSWPRLGLLYNVLNNTSSHYDLDYNAFSLSPDGDACRLRSESHQVSGSAVLCITTDFPSFFFFFFFTFVVTWGHFLGPLDGLCYYQLGRAGAIIVGPTTTRNGSGFPSAKDATHEQEIPAGLLHGN